MLQLFIVAVLILAVFIYWITEHRKTEKLVWFHADKYSDFIIKNKHNITLLKSYGLEDKEIDEIMRLAHQTGLMRKIKKGVRK